MKILKTLQDNSRIADIRKTIQIEYSNKLNKKLNGNGLGIKSG